MPAHCNVTAIRRKCRQLSVGLIPNTDRGPDAPYTRHGAVVPLGIHVTAGPVARSRNFTSSTIGAGHATVNRMGQPWRNPHTNNGERDTTRRVTAPGMSTRCRPHRTASRGVTMQTSRRPSWGSPTNSNGNLRRTGPSPAWKSRGSSKPRGTRTCGSGRTEIQSYE